MNQFPTNRLARRASLSRRRGQGAANIIGTIIPIVIGVLVLAAVISLGVILYNDFGTNSLVSDYSQVSSATKTLWSSSPTGYTNASAATIAATPGAVPASLLVGATGSPATGTGLQDSSHGAITVAGTTVGTAAVDNAYTIELAGLTPGQCSGFVTQDLGSEVQSIKIDGDTAVSGERVPVATAGTDCAAATNDVLVTVLP